MFKSKLNELCQRSRWKPPIYSCLKEGEDHIRLFRASVVVNGKKFHSSAPFKHSKDAYNDVAKIAFSRCSANSHEVRVADMKKRKKLKRTTMSSCSDMDKGALKETSDTCSPNLPEETDMEITPHVLAAPTIDKPNQSMSPDSYPRKVYLKVYTSIPEGEMPKGDVELLPGDEGKWTIVSLK